MPTLKTLTQPKSALAPIVFFAIVLGGLVGCGSSLSLTVPDDLLQRLPKNSRKSVFQAETLVTIAVDHKGSVKRQIDNAELEISRTKTKIDESKKERKAATTRTADKINLEINMLEVKIDYLYDYLDHQHIVLKLADRELLLARAQFELVKVQLVKKHSIAFNKDEEDFVKQVKKIEEDVNDFRKKVDAKAADLKKSEERWLAAKKEYYAAIGESDKGWWTEGAK
jgi:peptidoglycan hydrolase CwlO-like protein